MNQLNPKIQLLKLQPNPGMVVCICKTCICLRQEDYHEYDVSLDSSSPKQDWATELNIHINCFNFFFSQTLCFHSSLLHPSSDPHSSNQVHTHN